MNADPKKEAMIKVVKDAVMVEVKGQQLYSHAATEAVDPAAKATCASS